MNIASLIRSFHSGPITEAQADAICESYPIHELVRDNMVMKDRAEDVVRGLNEAFPPYKFRIILSHAGERTRFVMSHRDPDPREHHVMEKNGYWDDYGAYHLYVDRSQRCLTDGSPVSPDHREIDTVTGMQKAYVVLTAEERAKGFVRPVRRSYIHVGRPICGVITPEEHGKLGGLQYVCLCEPGHAGTYHHVKIAKLPQPEAMALSARKREGGCGSVTTMGLAIAETYARGPKFYSGTFCCACGSHFPLDQFVWDDGSGERVGS